MITSCSRLAAAAAVLAFVAGCADVSPPLAASAPAVLEAPSRVSISGKVPLLAARAPDVQAIASLADRGRLARYPARGLPRVAGAYTWHPVQVSEAHALAAIGKGGAVELEAPDGRPLHFDYVRHVEHAGGNWTWVGRMPGASGEEAILTFGERAAFGSIAQGQGRLPLRLTTRDGDLWMVDADAAKLAEAGAGAMEPPEGDSPLPPVRVPAAQAKAGIPAAEAAQVAAAGDTVIDLLVGYTRNFAADLGGDSQARTRLDFLVEVGNQAYINSGVAARLRLVHAMPVDYTESNTNNIALDELTGVDSVRKVLTTPNAAFSALRAARETYGADLVQLVRKFQTPEQKNCGIAWLNGGGNTAIVPTRDEFYGYSVIADGTDRDESDGKTYYCRSETMVHELGHNMGSAHDSGNSGSTGAYPYSHGYRTDAANGNFYTVMAYGESGQTSYRAFSNPASTYCGGFACGIADQADNARSLRLTMPLIAQFRATKVAVDPVVSSGTIADLDADGKADLVWMREGLTYFEAWKMDGGAMARATGYSMLPEGSRLLTLGDFNGDNKLDLVVADQNSAVSIWEGDGIRFAQKPLGVTHSTGYRPMGPFDVDADGRSDLLWVDSASDRIEVWLMNGAVRQGLRTYQLGTGMRVMTTGDFNGDGRVDLLVANAQNRLFMGLGTGSSFPLTDMNRSFAPGWTATGQLDYNGDGRHDLFWVSASGEGYFETWMMNGATLQAAQGYAAPAAYRVLGFGDFNGDKRTDVLFTSDGRELQMWTSNGPGFAVQVISVITGPGWKTIVPGR